MFTTPDLVYRTATEHAARLRDDAGRRRTARTVDAKSSKSALSRSGTSAPAMAIRDDRGAHGTIASSTWKHRVARLFAPTLPSQ